MLSVYALKRAAKEGMIKLSDEDMGVIKKHTAAFMTFKKDMEETPDSLKQKVMDDFNNSELTKKINAIFLRDGVQEAVIPILNLHDYEQILRKIIEPYRGKLVLLDVWGTWCGPCKEALAHSQEEYERLKDYPIVYLYLANRSPEENWKNVIKEYNITGDNVAHYNLPDAQQKAVENYLKINSFPTYKLFDQQGNLLDINANPRDLNAFENLIKRILGK